MIAGTTERGRCGISDKKFWAPNGPWLGQLATALMRAFVVDAQFDAMLSGLGHSFVAGDDRLGAFLVVVRTMRSEGRVEDLVYTATGANPGNPELTAWCAEHLPEALRAGSGRCGPQPEAPRSSIPAGVQPIDLAFFDLREIKAEIRRALGDYKPCVLGLGVTEDDETFLGSLYRWLSLECFPDDSLVPKGRVPLRSTIINVERQVELVLRYRPDLASRSVLCPVKANGATADAVCRFWNSLRDEIGRLDNMLIVVFEADTGFTFPENVIALPEPSFGDPEIREWASEMVNARRWPRKLTGRLTAKIISQATWENSIYLPFVYQEIDRSIREILANESDFLAMLETGEGSV